MANNRDDLNRYGRRPQDQTSGQWRAGLNERADRILRDEDPDRSQRDYDRDYRRNGFYNDDDYGREPVRDYNRELGRQRNLNRERDADRLNTDYDREIVAGPEYGTMGRDSNFSRSTNLGYGRESHVGKGPKGWQRSDENIRDQVCEVLERDAYIDASDIDVSVDDGIVTLEGRVDHRATKRHAEDIIDNLAGVKDVQNRLSVDQGFFQQMKEAITREPAPAVSASKRSQKVRSRH